MLPNKLALFEHDVPQATYKDLETVTVSLVQIGADNRCFQVNYINGMDIDHGHKTRRGNLFVVLLSFQQRCLMVIKALGKLLISSGVLTQQSGTTRESWVTGGL